MGGRVARVNSVVVSTDKENGFIIVKGGIPGGRNSIVEIKLKLLNGNKYDFTVNKNMTIRELYIKTSYITNINCISYFFVKNHYRLPKFEEIEDWMTLKDFNFKTNERNDLHLVLRLG